VSIPVTNYKKYGVA